MDKRRFGRTELQVSVVGFGGAPIGFLETEQRRVSDMLHRLLDRGVNVIDTAAMYAGSEEAIGRAIGHRRDEFVLVTKCGDPGNGQADWSAGAISAAVDRALERLRTERLDVMLLHSCDLETLRRGECVEALVQARDAGKIRCLGYSGDNEAAAYAAGLAEVSVVETSVNVCDQAAIETLLPVVRRNDVAVIAKRPLANAAWKELAEQPGLYADYARPYAERLARMGVTPAELGYEGDPREAWPEIALRFALSVPEVHTAIIGTTNPAHSEANLERAAKGPLPQAAYDRLRQAFLDAQQASGETWRGEV